RWLTCILLACCATPVLAEFMAVREPVPVDRLIANIQRHIDQKPDESHGWFVLARVHALAYARDGGQITVIDKEGSLPEFAPYDTVRVGRRPDAELSDAARNHLGKSINAYRKAIALDPKIAIYHLGLGWMLEQQALRATTQPADAVVNIEREAVEHYVRAIDLALDADLQRKRIMMGTDDAVSYEAA